MEREGFVFYKSFYEALRDIEDEHTRLQAYEAIITYGLYGTEPEHNKGIALLAFKLVKPQIDANNERFVNGIKGGRPSKKTIGFENENHRLSNSKPMVIENENHRLSNSKPKVKVKVKDKVKEKDINILSGKPDDVQEKNQPAEILRYLNNVCGTHYREDTPASVRLIRSRLAEGFTVQDFKSVIDNMHGKWAATEMARFLRPETLFGTKFESYLNAPAEHVPAEQSTFLARALKQLEETGQ